MSKAKTSIFVLVMILVTTGCLYPNEKRIENQIPYEDQLQSVQIAVNEFFQDSKVLPIKTRDEDTPIFRKYPIDFSRLIPRYIQDAPGNSFEKGGTYQYVLVHPEETFAVKLIDLKTVRTIQEYRTRVRTYQHKNEYAPVAEIVADGLFRLNYKALNYEEEPTVKSPFHPDHQLPLLLQNDGEIIIDYSIDIQYFIEEFGLGKFSEGDDLRWLLVEHAPFVPVNSRPQGLSNEQVSFLINE